MAKKRTMAILSPERKRAVSPGGIRVLSGAEQRALARQVAAANAKKAKAVVERPKGAGLRVRLEPISGLTKKGRMREAGYYFQCPPLEEFSADFGHSHTDYETPKAGQFSRSGGRSLITVSFDTLVVDYGSYTVIDGEFDMEDFTEVLRKLVHSGTPFLFTASHKIPNVGGYDNWKVEPWIQMPAVLRTLKVVEKAGEGDARYLNCAFVEYRDPVVGRLLNGRTGRAAAHQLPVTGKIKKLSGFFEYRGHGASLKTVRGTAATFGQSVPYAVTLRDLAKFFYGSPSKGHVIAKANKLSDWGRDTPLILHPRYKLGGAKLKIPDIPTTKRQNVEAVGRDAELITPKGKGKGKPPPDDD